MWQGVEVNNPWQGVMSVNNWIIFLDLFFLDYCITFIPEQIANNYKFKFINGTKIISSCYYLPFSSYKQSHHHFILKTY